MSDKITFTVEEIEEITKPAKPGELEFLLKFVLPFAKKWLARTQARIEWVKSEGVRRELD